MIDTGGLRIVVSNHHPRVPDGTEEQRYPANPIVVWLFRAINAVLRTRLDPDIVRHIPRYRDADMIFDRRTGTVYCSPQQAHALRATLAAQQQGARAR
jgi:hypothetical protein